MLMQFIKLKSKLPEDELLKKARERVPRFKETPGLLQKYYVKLKEEGRYGGVYIWDSPESLTAFRNSDLAATITEAYEITEAPEIELFDILFQLRD